MLKRESPNFAARAAGEVTRHFQEPQKQTADEQERKGVGLIYLKVIPFLYYSTATSWESRAEGLVRKGTEGPPPGHPLEIPEGRWKYETTGWRPRGCALSSRWRGRGEDGGKVKARWKYTAGGEKRGEGGTKGGSKRKLYSGQCSPAMRFNYFCSAPTTLPGNLPSAPSRPSHSPPPSLPVSRCGRGGRRF